MGRVVAIGLIVLGIWAAVELYNNGVDGAFGGVFADTYQAPAERSTPNRAADAFQRAYNKSEERVDRQLRQPGAQE
jgi:hypothetical protein